MLTGVCLGLRESRASAVFSVHRIDNLRIVYGIVVLIPARASKNCLIHSGSFALIPPAFLN